VKFLEEGNTLEVKNVYTKDSVTKAVADKVLNPIDPFAVLHKIVENRVCTPPEPLSTL
jgi:hypothetical protein